LTNENSGTANIIRYPINFRLFFNHKDTIGKVLGFKNVGESNSITPYNISINNTDKYENDTLFNQVGIINNNIHDRYILLHNNKYIFMTCPLFNKSYNNINNIFSIIIFNNNDDTNLSFNYSNEFVQLYENIENTINSLNDIEFTFYDDNG
jgi:hypothetical protein